MRKLILTAALFLCAPSAFAAWGSVSFMASSATIASGSSFVVTTSSTLEAGNVGVCVGAVNNDGDGTDTNDFGAVTDSAGNAWTVIAENEHDPGAAAAGSAVAIFYTVASVELATGATITINYGHTPTAKAATCWEFTMSVPAANQFRQVVLVSTIPLSDTANGDAPALGISGLESREHLFIRGIASETTNGDIGTLTSNFTKILARTHSTGTEGTSMGAVGEFRIVSATSQTSDPTMSDTTADRSTVYIALDENVLFLNPRRRTVVPVINQ